MGGSLDVTDYGHNGYKTVVVASVLIMMLSLMVGGRLVSRFLQKAALAADDYVLFVSTILSFGLCALSIAMPRIGGIGAYINTTPKFHSSKDANIEKTFIAWMILYGFTVALSKCAILLLYLRVFTTRNRAFTIASYLFGFIIVAVCLVNTFGVIFQCTPVQFAWNKNISGGSCINFVAFERYTAIPNIITGLIMLVMPLPLVWKLNVSLAAKLALTATFLHGSIGLVSSAVRLAQLFWPESSTGVNDAAIAWTIWTINEPSNYVIAACLPTLRPIFIRILPSSFFLSKKRTTNRPYSSSPQGSKEKNSSRRSTFGVHITNPRFSGPWSSRYVPEPHDAQEFHSSEKNLVATRGDFFVSGEGDKVRDLENGGYVVTKTVAIGSQEQL